MSVIRHGRKSGFRGNPWRVDLMARKPAMVVAVALANKNARSAWALMAAGEAYRRTATVQA